MGVLQPPRKRSRFFSAPNPAASQRASAPCEVQGTREDTDADSTRRQRKSRHQIPLSRSYLHLLVALSAAAWPALVSADAGQAHIPCRGFLEQALAFPALVFVAAWLA